MRLSIVIPAYNEERLLPACLRAVLGQKEPADEIIVVDNNSTDATAEIAQRFGATVIRESRQGICFARNAGFNAATGDIIARCDADTAPAPDWTVKIKRQFENSSVDSLAGSCVFYDLPLRRQIRRIHIAAYFGVSWLMFGHHTLFGCNMAIRKRVWEKVRDQVCMDEEQIHEDIDLALHISDAGGTIVFDPDIISATSGRRVHSSFPSLARYLAKWPGTKSYHKTIVAARY